MSHPGQDCEQFVNLCDESPCENNGTCTPDGASYRCICPLRFEGDQCETPLVICRDGFCQNGGHCNDEDDDGENVAKFCSCPEGFNGKKCLIRHKYRKLATAARLPLPDK